LRQLSEDESNELENYLAQQGEPFATQEEAEAELFATRDRDLAELASLGAQYPELKMDFKALSLKRLEQFYFTCYVDKKTNIPIEKDRFETLLTQYLRQVFVANDMAEWFIEENDFAPGRFSLNILYGYGALSRENAYSLDERNEKRTYLYKTFMMFVPKEREAEMQGAK
jgi:hypothetical protein